jgi:hypothetical protein
MSSDFPDVKLKALISFPSQAYGRLGIDVAKSNGSFFIDIDYSEFGVVSSLPVNPNLCTLVYDVALRTYVLAPVSLVGTGGLADAPNDGFTYGRNSAAWVRLVAATRAQRIVTASGPVTALATDDIIIIRKTVGAPTTVNVDWSIMTRPLTIVDGKADAQTNNITVVPSAGQTQFATVNYPYVIDSNGGAITFTPLADGSGAF